MIKNTINEEETFAVNEDYDTRLYKFGKAGVHVLVVDNFYKNPHLVRQLALDINSIIEGNVVEGEGGEVKDSNIKKVTKKPKAK